jgi:GDP-L-fucose synthase
MIRTITIGMLMLTTIAAMSIMNHSSKIFIAGHTGLVGSALLRTLRAQGYYNIITRTHAQLDLCCQQQVDDFFAQEKPELVFVAAARVGGIIANSTYPVNFLYENTMIAMNVLSSAQRSGTRKILFLGSSCIYPRDCAQPIREEYLLTGPLEPTNQWYALAKITALKLCEAFHIQYKDQPGAMQCIAAMPTNLYGIGDTFDSQLSHVIPALIMKISVAKNAGCSSITLWGTGTALREFLYVDDLAEALIMLMQSEIRYGLINIGSGEEYSIKELATIIAEEIGFSGEIIFDNYHPDGTPRKLLDVSRMIEYGWQPKTSLREGLRNTIAWYLSQQFNRSI